ncbi:MAG TPA: hypothetical protein VGQ04_16465 [Chitinophagaceae bacterium]|nr:hypothetical protein [Chitinophagaceae bacterium]
MKRIVTLALISICFSCSMQAQTDSTQSKPQFKVSVNCNSNLNYYGRTDSLKSSGVFPMAELWFKNFYINAAPVFVSNVASSFDYAGTVATAGYMSISDDKKWFSNFYVVKPFYESNSQLVQSALKLQGAFSITYLNKLVNITGGADVKISDKTDFGITAGIDHVFRKQFADNSVLVIDPSAFLYAGTQQFTSTYYKRNSFIPVPISGQTVSEEVKKLNILSYEFSMPVIFTKKKFQVLFSPAYVIPQNLITVQGRPDLSERGQEMFYVTIGAKIIL